jgi:peptidoglycan/LPS O-acetylase OafA/YrhL
LLDRKLAFPHFEKLGDASYALYLVHPAMIALVRAVALRGAVDPVAAPWLYFLGLVTLCIGAALLVHRWLEKPITEGMKRRLDAWQHSSNFRAVSGSGCVRPGRSDRRSAR